MDWLTQLFWHDGKFLGIDWSVWKVVGWLGNAVFFSRFFVQWYATERLKRVVVPVAFWWLSLIGSGLLLSYAVFWKKDSVFIFAYAFVWIPYLRMLIIHHRHANAQQACSKCGQVCPPHANFCYKCGWRLSSVPEPAEVAKR